MAEQGHAGVTHINTDVQDMVPASRPVEPSPTDIEVMKLSEIAKKGDQHAIDSLLRLLKNDQHGVRLMVVLALRQLVEPGNNRVLDALRNCVLEDPDCVEVRPAALEASARIAGCGDPGIIRLVTDNLKSASWHMRLAAVKSLPHVAQQDDLNCMFEKLADSFEDKNNEIKRAATQAMAELQRRSEHRVREKEESAN